MSTRFLYNYKKVLAIVAITSALLTAYSIVVDFNWAWDDYLLFVDSPRLRTEQIDWSALFQPILQGTTYLRPLVLLSFAIEFKYFGADPAIAHIVNLGIFVVNTLFVFGISSKIFCKLGISSPIVRSLLVALLYGLHPAMTESVAWISGRFDLLCTTFALLMLVVALSELRETFRALLIATAFWAALLCKEMAATAPLLVFLILISVSSAHKAGSVYISTRTIIRQRWPTATLLVATAVGYAILRVSLMNHFIHEDNGVIKHLTGANEHLILVLRTVAFYAGLAIAPFSNLSPFHSIDFETLSSLSSLLICLSTFILIAIICLLAWKRNVFGLLLLAALISLLPISQIIPLTIAGSIGAERFLTLPLAFFLFALGAIEPIKSKIVGRVTQIVIVRLFLASWLLMAAGCLYVTVPLWRNDMTLWSWTYQQHPDSIIARQSYLNAAIRNQQFESAKRVFESIKQHEGFDPITQLIYGNYLVQTQQVEQGIAYLRGALDVFPRPDLRPEETLDPHNRVYVAYGFSTLAIAYLDQKQYQEAFEAAQVSEWYRPYSGTSKFWTSLALYGLNRDVEADAAFSLAVAWYPDYERHALQLRKVAFIKSLGEKP